MTTKRAVLGAVLLATTLGALAALPLGGHRRLSVDLWLVTASGWFMLLFIRGVFDAVPVEVTQRRGIWGRATRPEDPPVRLPRDLVALEGTVIGGRDSERAYRRRLQPRLIDISSHLLLSRHGIDLERQPAKAAEILGDVGWLLNPEAIERKVRIDEMDRLLDRLSPQDEQSFEQPDRSSR